MILKEIYVTMCKHRHRLVSNGVANEPMGQCSLDECIKYRDKEGGGFHASRVNSKEVMSPNFAIWSFTTNSLA